MFKKTALFFMNGFPYPDCNVTMLPRLSDFSLWTGQMKNWFTHPGLQGLCADGHKCQLPKLYLEQKSGKLSFFLYFFLQTDKEISEKRQHLTLRPVTWKRREILGWIIKGKMIALYRGPNAFLAKIGCWALTVFWWCKLDWGRPNAID